MSRLEDRLEKNRRENEWATTWKPGRGEILVGTFEGMDEGDTEYGTSKIAHIRDEEGELWGVWLFHTVLKDQWGEADPETGDRVGIVYMGERSGSAHDYHAYTVEVERREHTDATGTDDREASDRDPQESDASDVGEDELFGTPARDSETEGGESTLDDPNGELPY